MAIVFVERRGLVAQKQEREQCLLAFLACIEHGRLSVLEGHSTNKEVQQDIPDLPEFSSCLH